MPEKHRVRNWNAYNKALRRRGDLFLYFDENFLNSDWFFQGKRNPGGLKKYSDASIQMMLSVRSVLRLPLRQAQGFVESVIQRLGLDTPTPDYSTVCRRAKSLNLKVKLQNQIDLRKPLHLLIDSTGLSVYSGTNFHVTKYNKDRKVRGGDSWRKLHIAFDLESAQVVNAELTKSNVQDASPVASLTQVENSKVASIRADRAYDRFSCYRIAEKLGSLAIVPPRRDARLQSENRNYPYDEAVKARDNAINHIRMFGTYEDGVKDWKKKVDYHKRSRVEALMHRYKRAFGYSLQSKTEDAMRTEVFTKINILNKQISLGAAEFERATA